MAVQWHNHTLTKLILLTVYDDTNSSDYDHMLIQHIIVCIGSSWILTALLGSGRVQMPLQPHISHVIRSNSTILSWKHVNLVAKENFEIYRRRLQIAWESLQINIWLEDLLMMMFLSRYIANLCTWLTMLTFCPGKPGGPCEGKRLKWLLN